MIAGLDRFTVVCLGSFSYVFRKGSEFLPEGIRPAVECIVKTAGDVLVVEGVFRAAGRVAPVDIAVRRGIEQFYDGGEERGRAEMRTVAEPWRPYRSVATRYIWAEYEADD